MSYFKLILTCVNLSLVLGLPYQLEWKHYTTCSYPWGTMTYGSGVDDHSNFTTADNDYFFCGETYTETAKIGDDDAGLSYVTFSLCDRTGTNMGTSYRPIPFSKPGSYNRDKDGTSTCNSGYYLN